MTMVRATAKNSPRFHIGEHVRLVDFYDKSEAVILEDRGNLGVGGRRLYRIRVLLADAEQPDIEVRAEELAPLLAIA